MTISDKELRLKIMDLRSTTSTDELHIGMVLGFQDVTEHLFEGLAKETGIDEELIGVGEDAITGKMFNKDRCLFYLNSFADLVKGSTSEIVQKSTDLLRVQKENDTLKNEAISDKKSIIELQEKVIDQAEKKLHDVQSTVQSEIKTFSSIVKDTCAAALAPSKIQTAMKKVQLGDSRDQNIIIYGVPEKADEDVSLTVSAVFEEVGDKPRVVSCTRLGAQGGQTIRPIKCCLSSSAFVFQILKNAAKLKQSENFGTVYLSPDRTPEERRKRRQLVEQFKLKRSENPGINYRIDFRNYVIVHANNA